MSESLGEKTEQPTQRRLEEAVKQGQIARSAEVQTVFVLLFGLMALRFTGHELYGRLTSSLIGILTHLHEIPVSAQSLPGYFNQGAMLITLIVSPIAAAAMVGGLVAGGIQNRFQTAPEALTPKWERLNPISGLKRIFSAKALTPASLGIVKLGIIFGLSYKQLRHVADAPIFHTALDAARISSFMADAAFRITLSIGLSLVLIAALDYAFQFWRTYRDMMMTRQEVKEEMRNSEGDPNVKARQRRRRNMKSQRQMLLEVHKADVVVTNPTHLAVALRYDRKTMNAPRIVAKGSRLNALKIRELAARHGVPIVENKPLARVMFKYGKVGGEIPAQLYAAVAEVLAYVYRVNRYRYYTEQNRVAENQPAQTGNH